MRKTLLLLVAVGFVVAQFAAAGDCWAGAYASAGWMKTRAEAHTRAGWTNNNWDQSCDQAQSGSGSTSDAYCHSLSSTPKYSEAWAHAVAKPRWRVSVSGKGAGWVWSYKDLSGGNAFDTTDAFMDADTTIDSFTVTVTGEMTTANEVYAKDSSSGDYDTLFVAVYPDTLVGEQDILKNGTGALRAGKVIFGSMSLDTTQYYLYCPEGIVAPGGNAFKVSNFTISHVAGGHKATYNITFKGTAAPGGKQALGLTVCTGGFGTDTPTLTEWGLIILAVLAVGGVIWTIVRRKRILLAA